ncbi:hypothetical protein PMI14_03681 [Acidovorax sp. CF316]|nr:hypothetical protein PMI14_03681 [Acidovorax sp. CF316]
MPLDLAAVAAGMPRRREKEASAFRAGTLMGKVAGGLCQLPATFMRFTRMEPTDLAP